MQMQMQNGIVIQSTLFTFMYSTLWCDVLKYPILQDEGDNYFSILMQLC